LDHLYAIMRDMSANALLKALNDAGVMPARGTGFSVPLALRVPRRTRLVRRKLSLAARPLPASGFARMPVFNTGLIAALALFLVGCAGLQSGNTAKTILLAPADTRTTLDAPTATKKPEAPSSVAPPALQNSPRISETKPQSATAAKGAERLVASTTKLSEKLLAASAPALVRASERTTLPAQPADPKPQVTQDSGAVTGASVKELIIKGPPHQAPQPRAGMKALVWLGLGLGCAALAVVTRILIIRRPNPSSASPASKDELKMPSELLFKESVMAPEEPVAAEKP
jgi:hypothetical protein